MGDRSVSRRESEPINRGFLKGCYVPQKVLGDLEYQEVFSDRMKAALEDIREPEKWDFELFKQEYPGIPLKHFVDNFSRYDDISHDQDCPTPSHEPFFLKFMGDLNNNKFQWFKPDQCPKFPRVWQKWHDEFDVDKLRKMPMKFTFEFDIVNYVSDPQPMQPSSTKNLITVNTYLISPSKVVITQQSQGRDFMFSDRF